MHTSLPMGNAPTTRTTDMQKWLSDKGYTGFFMNRTDEFQGEYLPKYAERLWWLTGFSGSAGQVIISPDYKKSAVFSDGRYTIQLDEQVNAHMYNIVSTVDISPYDWIGKVYQAGDSIAYDPWLFTPTQLAEYTKVCHTKGIKMVAVDKNPIDILWHDQPAPPIGEIRTHPMVVAGVSHTDKIQSIAHALQNCLADSTLMTLSCAISWTFNIRGTDIPFNPVVLSYALINKDCTATLYMETDKINSALLEHVGDRVTVKGMESFIPDIQNLTGTVAIDNRFTPCGLIDNIGANTVTWEDWAYTNKAYKNAWEQDSMRQCHVRDGLAMVRMLHWIDTTPYTEQDEWTNAQKLYEFRSHAEEFRDLSFDSISGFAGNGSICHYRVAQETSLPFHKDGKALNGLYVLDSGSQYTDGTTDITRTICIGTATDAQKHDYTLVLKGFIACMRTKFTPQISPAQLDGIARQYLLMERKDYAHGTGHGIGCAMNVHEGPIGIATKYTAPYKQGAIVSIEPGYYQRDAYGIRIENLAIAQPTGDAEWLEWENLTWCPIDTRIIDAHMLNETEKDWLNNYHNMVWKKLSPFFDNKTDMPLYEWLINACEPII